MGAASEFMRLVNESIAAMSKDMDDDRPMEAVQAVDCYSPPLSIAFRGATDTMYWFPGNGGPWPSIEHMDLADLAVLNHLARNIVVRTEVALAEMERRNAQ